MFYNIVLSAVVVLNDFNTFGFGGEVFAIRRKFFSCEMLSHGGMFGNLHDPLHASSENLSIGFVAETARFNLWWRFGIAGRYMNCVSRQRVFWTDEKRDLLDAFMRCTGEFGLIRSLCNAKSMTDDKGLGICKRIFDHKADPQ